MANDKILDNIVGFPTVTHVQRSYNWDFFLPDLWGILVSGLVISKYCQSVSLGQYNVGEVIELKAGVNKKFFPGSMEIDMVNATFVSPVPDLVTWYFSKWKSLIVDKMNRYQPSSVYKKNGYIILYDRSGIPANIIRLIGLWPVKFPAFNLSYEQEDVVKFEISFRVDKVELGFKALGGLGSDIGSRLGGGIKDITGSLGG